MTSRYSYEDNIVSEIVGKQPSWIIRGGIGVLLFSVLTILALSGFVQYPDAIHAPISIISDVPPVQLVARRNGYIGQLVVKDGEKVNKNQNLIILESRADYNVIEQLKDHLEIFNLSDVQKNQQVYLKLGELQNIYNQFKKIILDYHLFINSNQLALKKENIGVLIDKYISLDNEFKNKLNTATEKYSLQKSRLDAHDALAENGSVSGNTLISIKQKMLELQSNIENIRIIRKENELIQIELKQVITEEELKQRNKNIILKNEIETLRISLLSRINEWKRKNIIIAPTSGIISFTKHWGVNQYIKIGQEVLTISPYKFSIEGRMKISGKGVGKIEKMQKVYIELNSFPAHQFGQLKGTVSSISLVPDQDGYLVKIDLPKQLKTTYDYNVTHAPMYNGNAKIILKERSLLSRLFDSISYLLKKDS